jgi:hypothetical protein
MDYTGTTLLIRVEVEQPLKQGQAIIKFRLCAFCKIIKTNPCAKKNTTPKQKTKTLRTWSHS